MIPFGRHRTDIALVVGALLLVVVVIADRGSVTSAEAEDRKQQLFDAWRADDLGELDVRLGDRRIVLSSKEDVDGTSSWHMRENDRDVDVDVQAVEQLLLSLEYASFERRIDGLNDATLGFAAPRLALELSMGRLHYRLLVGAEAPSPPGAAYAEVSGGARGRLRCVIGPELVDELLTRPAELRSRMMAVYLSPQVQSFTLTSATNNWKLVRGGWGGRTAAAFLVEAAEPVGRTRASRRAVDSWLALLAQLEAERFLPLPAEPQQGGTRIRITPRAADAPGVELVLAGSCPGGAGRLLVRTAPDPVAACVAADVAEELSFRAVRFVDRQVVGTADGDIMELRLSGPAGVVDLARKGEGWLMREPRAGDADAEPVSTLLERLLAAEGVPLPPAEASDLEALGLQPAAGELRILGLPERATATDADERVEIVSIGARRGDYVHIRRQDDGAVLRLEPQIAQALTPDATVLRSPAVYDWELRRLRELRIDCGGVRQRLERDLTGAWKMLDPAIPGLSADMGLANEFATNLGKLRAVRWVAAAASPAQRLAEPWCVVEANVDEVGDDGTRTKRVLRLELGAETSGGHFARHDDDLAVFVAPGGLGAMARRWMLDRAALLVAAERIEGVTVIARGDRRLRVDVRAGRWLPQGAAPALGEVVKQAVTQLVAEGVTHLGPAAADEGIDDPLLRIEIERADDEADVVILVGNGDVWRDTSVFKVRRSGVGASFAVAQARLKPLIDAL